MRMKLALSVVICGSVMALIGNSASAQLFTEDFDDGLAVNRWNAFAGVGWSDTAATISKIPDTNFDTSPVFPEVDGVIDNTTGFAFDYSTAGIPAAPNSTGGSTIGLKLQANLFSAALGGFSVSPKAESIPVLTGDYVMKFDHWANTIGPMPLGGSGSTNVSTFGILTTGTFSQSVLSTDGLFFGYTADGESSADFRAYSIEDKDSYDGSTVGTAVRGVYHAGNRNLPASVGGVPGAGLPLYNEAFGTGVTVPEAQTTIAANHPEQTANQSGTINSGAAGFQWNEIEIKKIGDFVEWHANGVHLMTVGPLSEFTTPTAGTNISFGHADINTTSSADPADYLWIFSLVDNIRIEAIESEEDLADFEPDGDIDGRDFLTWQRNVGVPDAQRTDGDADGDGDVDGDDLGIWQTQYDTPPLSSLNAVPEPASIVTMFGAAMLLGLHRQAGRRAPRA